jgi:hypothetical protein
MAELTILARTPVSAVAAALGFGLAAAFWLSLGPIEGWPYLAMFVAVPAAIVALMPLPARAFCLALGLLAMLGAALMDISGPDNPLLIFPLAGGSAVAGTAVAEACVRAALRLTRSRGNGRAPDSGL